MLAAPTLWKIRLPRPTSRQSKNSCVRSDCEILGGIIVIDFIDMADSSNRQKVLDELQAEMKKDKAPSKILGFNEFGLVAVTRKRVNSHWSARFFRNVPSVVGGV